MNKNTTSNVVATQHRLLEVLKCIVDGLSATSKEGSKQAYAQASELLSQPLPAVGWTDERRSAMSAKMRRPRRLLYLWESANQPPERLDYTAAAAKFGLAPQSLRTHISNRGGGYAAKVNGRVIAVATEAEGLSRALSYRYLMTGDPDDLLELSGSARY